MDGGMGPGAVALLAVEVLDEGGKGVEVAARRIPANQHLPGVCAQVEGEHLLLVIHVDLDLLGGFRVGDSVAVADLDFGAIFAAGAEESANYTFLVGGAAERVVEYGEDGLVTLSAQFPLLSSHRRVPGVVWRRSAGRSRVEHRRGLGQAGAPGGGTSLARTWRSGSCWSDFGIRRGIVRRRGSVVMQSLVG